MNKLRRIARHKNDTITIEKQSVAIRALHCIGFFPKIPEIDLRRFSFKLSPKKVIVAIHDKFEKFQNIYTVFNNKKKQIADHKIKFAYQI